MNEVHKKVCRECPFRRVSPAGFLGSASWDPRSFLGPHLLGSVHLPCHMTIDWRKPDAQEQAREKPMCRGFAIMCRNANIIPRGVVSPEILKAIDPDYESIFSNPHEFIAHHEDLEMAGRFKT